MHCTNKKSSVITFSIHTNRFDEVYMLLNYTRWELPTRIYHSATPTLRQIPLLRNDNILILWSQGNIFMTYLSFEVILPVSFNVVSSPGFVCSKQRPLLHEWKQDLGCMHTYSSYKGTQIPGHAMQNIHTACMVNASHSSIVYVKGELGE